MSRYMITGGAGFIGSNMAHELRSRGDDVVVLDNLSSGYRHNLVDSGAQLVVGDIRNQADVLGAMKGADYVLHLAAIPSVGRSVEDPLGTHDVNLNGTLNVFLAARELGVKRVVMAGSSAVYGDSDVLPKVETMKPQPLSPYALHKLAGETYGTLFTQLYGCEVAITRYFNVFGPRQDPQSEYAAVIPKFIELMLAGKQPKIFGDGTASRDFCFIENVVEATLSAATAPAAAGNVYNVGCGDQITLLELVDAINVALGTQMTPILSDPRPGDILHSVADISAAKRDLGCTAAVKFADGLKRTVTWYAERAAK